MREADRVCEREGRNERQREREECPPSPFVLRVLEHAEILALKHSTNHKHCLFPHTVKRGERNTHTKMRAQ